MSLTDVLKQVLDECGMKYIEENGAVQLIMCRGGHKWNVAFVEDEQSFLRYYARYPWAVSQETQARLLSELNEMNERLRAGCFMLSGGYVVFRCGIYIFDDFIAKESISDLIVTAVSKTDAEWLHIYKTLFSGVIR